MGGVIKLVLFMLIIACVAFAPLAYFIYLYTIKKKEPFGDIAVHDQAGSTTTNWVDKLVDPIAERLSRK